MDKLLLFRFGISKLNIHIGYGFDSISAGWCATILFLSEKCAPTATAFATVFDGMQAKGERELRPAYVILFRTSDMSACEWPMAA